MKRSSDVVDNNCAILGLSNIRNYSMKEINIDSMIFAWLPMHQYVTMKTWGNSSNSLIMKKEDKLAQKWGCPTCSDHLKKYYNFISISCLQNLIPLLWTPAYKPLPSSILTCWTRLNFAIKCISHTPQPVSFICRLKLQQIKCFEITLPYYFRKWLIKIIIFPHFLQIRELLAQRCQ